MVLITNKKEVAYELSIGTKIGRAVLFAVAELIVSLPWHNHVNLNRQTGQLLHMSVKMSLNSVQNVVCPHGSKAMPERGAFTYLS